MKRKLARNSAAQERRIAAGIAADPDTYELSDTEFSQLHPLRLRGRPKLARAKVQVTLRLDPEVLAFFRAGGTGWQTRLNRVLVKYVTRQRRP